MTLEQALKAEVGDILIAAYNTASNFKGGDEVILIELTGDKHGDTRGRFYHRGDKQCYNGNIQDFRFRD
jgi:hypothetical protein